MIKYSQEAVDQAQPRLDALTADELTAAIARVLTSQTIEATLDPID